MNSAQQAHDISTIRALMEQSGGAIRDNGTHHIIWGALVAAAMLATYAYVRGAFPVQLGWIWAAAIGSGWALSLVVGIREERAAPVRNPASRALSRVWIGIGITLSLLGLLGASRGLIEGAAIPAIGAAAFGLGYFATGSGAGLRWLTWLAVAWWAGSAYLLLDPTPRSMLVFTAMVLVLEVGTGIALRIRAKSHP